MAALVAAGLAWTAVRAPEVRAAAGDLDPGFGTGGFVRTRINESASAFAVTIQPDGKIVAAGLAHGPGTQFAVARYLADGRLDPTFGGDGVVTEGLRDRGWAFSVAVQQDGKIVAAGHGFVGSSGDFGVMRWNPDGTLDLSWNGSGKVNTAILGSDIAEGGLAIQPDGKVVVGGHSVPETASGDAALVRYNPDGSLDRSFGGDGMVTTSYSDGHDGVDEVVLLPDGRIMTAGTAFATPDTFVIARYSADGALDPSLGGTGVVTTDVRPGDDVAQALVLQPDQNVVAGGRVRGSSGGNDFGLVRYSPDGTVDVGFGQQGVVTTTLGLDALLHDLALQPDGKLLAAGLVRTQEKDNAVVVRYNADGSLDAGFGAGGVVTTAFGEGADTTQSITVQPDGKLVTAGTSCDPGAIGSSLCHFAVARYGNDPRVVVRDVAVVEGDSGSTEAVFTVDLSTAAGAAGVQVSFGTADATAMAPGDYAPTRGVLSFGPGERRRTVSVAVRGDDRDEPAEWFTLNLSEPVNAVLGNASARGDIMDDEPLVIETAAGAPSLIERVRVRDPGLAATVTTVCLDPGHVPCIDFTGPAPGSGPNPRRVGQATFTAFNVNGDLEPDTRTNVEPFGGLRTEAALEVRFDPPVPAASLTMVASPDRPADLEAFYASGASALLTSVSSPNGESRTTRIPRTPPAQVAQQPFALASAGSRLYVADPGNHLVRFLDLGGGEGSPCPCESVFAGNGALGTAADEDDPLGTELAGPYAVALRPSSSPARGPDVYIADTFGHRVLRVSPSDRASGSPAVITTVAGTGTFGMSGDGGPAVNAMLNSPFGIAHDAARNVTYVADTLNHRVRALLPDSTIATVAGTGTAGGGGDGGPAAAAQLNEPRGLAVDASGNLYVADSLNHRVRRVDRATGAITTLAGTTPGFGGDGGPAVAAQLESPAGVAVTGAAAPTIYVADTDNHRIRRVTPNGLISTVAGTGTAGFNGDGPAARATLNSPFGVSVQPGGSLVVADTLNNRVRLVSDGEVRTVAGNGTASYGGDVVPAPAAQLSGVSALARGALMRASSTSTPVAATIMADPFTHSVRELRASDAVVTLTGDGRPGTPPDDGPAGDSRLSHPFGVATDRGSPPRYVYVADTFNNAVRRIDRVTGAMTRLAGDGTAGFAGDGGPAVSARLSFPTGVAADRSGNVYVADAYNARVRRIDPAGVISTVAGTGRLGFAGDGAPGTGADLFFPYAVAVDDATPANLFVADTFNHRVRRVDGATGVITTVAGDGSAGFSGDGGAATAGRLNRPWGVDLTPVDPGSVYVADSLNSRVRRVDGATGRLSTLAAAGVVGHRGDRGRAALGRVSVPRGVLALTPKLVLVGDSFGHRVRRVGLPAGRTGPEPVVIRATSFDLSCSVECPTETVTLTNGGDVTMHVTGVTLAGPDAGDFRVTRDGCTGAKLAPSSAGCSMRVSFRPSVSCPSLDPCRAATLLAAGNGADAVRAVSLAGVVQRPTCFGRPATITGTHGDDDLVGTDGPDVIHAGAGNDVIKGRGGNDVICAGDGDDGVDVRNRTVNGGAGDDLISGGGGVDAIEGDAGDDEIFGDEGDDVLLDGGEGDCCNPATNTGDDRIWGGAGDDVLWSSDFGRVQADGGPGNDTLHGAAGPDVLIGGVGDDEVDGREGNDHVGTRDGLDNDTGDTGPGVDVCFIDAGDRVTGCGGID